MVMFNAPRDRTLSLWQSAVEQVAAETGKKDLQAIRNSALGLTTTALAAAFAGNMSVASPPTIGALPLLKSNSSFVHCQLLLMAPVLLSASR